MNSVFSPIKEMRPDEIKRVMEIKLLGYANCTLAVLKRTLSRDRDKIIFVGSALSCRAIPLQSAYCASEFAIRGFFEALRCELLHDKSQIGVTLVTLPALNTPQFG